MSVSIDRIGINWLSDALCQCGMGTSRDRRGDGRIDPGWSLRKATRETWALDGLPPGTVSNARSLAGQIMADAKRGRADRIATLLDREGLDLDQSSVLLAATDLANGNTALMLAAKNGHAECCRLLLTRGADPLATNRHKQTAGDLATGEGHEDVVQVLYLTNAAVF